MNIKEILEQHKIWVTSFGENGARANLRGADLRCADLRGANLSDADLRCADLRGADLSCANLRGADLRCADLRGANLSDADLRCADLRGADLSCANLRCANLRDANLRCADLRGANLSDANLRCANLSGADLSCADLPKQTFIITGEKYFISITNGDYVRAGCQSHSIESWRKFSKNEIAEMDGKNALRFYPRLLDIIDFYCGKGERPNWVKEGVNDEPHAD